ncbi:hypothetical protein [Microbacterium sp. H1-D42]|uniref:hypothetical protein n=1 Tax=Microbacterium sp. H1-D42 TaxID=2925844 RepID=UPI001F537BE3|nr:hypothetical protein [Microbacterium sp. H1-D42]UNK71372.1 hypothetical protein MNR00_02645 [Microbacterium sp. H1-D42]
MNTRLIRRLVPALVGTVLASALIGCAPSEKSLEGARHEIYSSNEAVIESSNAMVTGTVVSQSETQLDGDMAPTTFSEVKVETSYAPKGLAAKLTDSSVTQIRTGVTVTVMQLGGKGWETPYQLLKEGETYLLMLSDSMLAERPGFYTTGGPAGIFSQTDVGFAPTSTDGDALTPYSVSQLQAIPAR